MSGGGSADDGATASDRRAGRYHRGSEEFGRVLSFVDGVVAIALTLLILNVDVPRPEGDQQEADLWPVLGDLTPQLVAFVLSFVIISIYWYNHHRFMSRLRAIDVPMMAWTLVFLFTVVLMPLQAQIIGFYSGNEQAVALYAGSFVAFGVVSVVGYLLAVHRELVRDEMTPEALRTHLASMAVPPVVFGLSIPVALFVSPAAAMYSWILIWPASVVLDKLYGEPPGP